MPELDSWDKTQNILVILAHPDDPEFFCGATIAKWCRSGHQVSYCLMTSGDKGVNEHFQSEGGVENLRQQEQNHAAKILGVKKVIILDNLDGYLQADLNLRKQIVRVIRAEKPDVVVSCDPTNYYIGDTYINHPDHRTAGQVVIDSVFPAAQNPKFFPELLEVEGLQPHHVSEVWLALPKQPNVIMDVTEFWDIKIQALHAHVSQIGEISEFDKRMALRHTEDSTPDQPRYEESFHRIIIRR